jgi:hypothetical protein
VDYPVDGTPFELDNETVQLLYNAAAGKPLTDDQRRAAVRAVDYISAARLLIEPEEDEEEDA